MAEKKLRKELDDIVRELIEIKGELKPRLNELKKIGTPPALFVVGLIGMKIGLKIGRAVVVRLWRSRFFIPILLLIIFISYNKVRYGKPEVSG